MPFDGKPLAPPILKPEVATALRDLVAYLRGRLKERWSFECGYSCAQGQARHVPSCVALIPMPGCYTTWHLRDEAFSVYGVVEFHRALRAGGVPNAVIASFFYGGAFGPVEGLGGERGQHYNCSSWMVTSQMVADRIEHWLNTGEIR